MRVERDLEHFAFLMHEKKALLKLWCDFYARLAKRICEKATNPALQTFDKYIENNFEGHVKDKHRAKLLPYLQDVTTLCPAWQIQELNPIQCLVLLPKEIMRHIALYVALTIHQKKIANLIKKDDIIALHTLVGQEGWYFALRKSPLHKGESLAHLFAFGEENTIESLEKTGASVIEFCINQVSEPLQAQVHATLPDDFYQSCPSLTDEESSLLQNIILKIVQDEVDPIWKNIIF